MNNKNNVHYLIKNIKSNTLLISYLKKTLNLIKYQIPKFSYQSLYNLWSL